MSDNDFDPLDDIDPELDLTPWADLSSSELVYRLKRGEREARQAKAALGQPARLDLLDGGLRDNPVDFDAFLTTLGF